MAAQSLRSFPRKWESSREHDGKSRIPASAGTSGSPSPKIGGEIEHWLTHLGAERRYSPKTLEAYRRDVRQFLDFLVEHLGGPPSLKDLTALTPADVRAF
ncbi:MAG: site-specific integrase, partial [Xanthobacteraceae bacterium]